jgi:hypothetical protein
MTSKIRKKPPFPAERDPAFGQIHTERSFGFQQTRSLSCLPSLPERERSTFESDYRSSLSF